MLVRSQNKEVLVTLELLLDIEVSGGVISARRDMGWCCLLGEYSTKAKAMKVLDMIQEAYADFESAKITSTGLTAAAYTGNYDTSESVAYGIKVLKDYTEMIRELIVFQMPADSEVVV
nr:MAG TPA: hypothetical protein [Caudoviricetes sp.]